jgi:hypothetical protein
MFYKDVGQARAYKRHGRFLKFSEATLISYKKNYKFFAANAKSTPIPYISRDSSMRWFFFLLDLIKKDMLSSRKEHSLKDENGV